MKLTKQDYQNALEIWLSYRKGDSVLLFIGYLEKIIAELEQPKTPMYRCIQLPRINNGFFKLGELYDNSGLPKSCNLSDLPKHFELVEPEPEPKTVSPWRTDIENAPRRTILILDSQNDPFLVYPDDYAHDTWGTSAFDDDIFKNSEIAYWMPIPELPK